MPINSRSGFGFAVAVPDVRELIGLPDFPAIATATSIAAKLRGLAEVENAGTTSGGQRLTMLALGMFLFGLDTLAFDELSRRTGWRHGATERFAAPAAWQFLGPGEDNISLPGLIVPEFAGKISSLAQVRDMAATGDAYPLVESGGTVLGQYIILSMEERRSVFLPGGQARRVEFNIELSRVDG